MSISKKIIIPIVGVLAASVAGGVGLAYYNASSDTAITETTTISTDNTTIELNNMETVVTEGNQDFLDDADWSNTIIHDGKTYRLRDDIRTILFMGIDSEVEVSANDVTGGGGRADTVLLFVIDETSNKMDILEISRDSMVDVDVYNFDRDYLYTGKMQICMQYSFSDSSTRGCILMRDHVSALLYGIDIDNYCSLTVEGMISMVEEMGGITLTFEDDYSFIDERYVPGATVTLNSSDVNKFVRYRDTDETGSNNGRMDRQAWFMKELFTQMTTKGGTNLISLYEAAGSHICTDMDAEEIKNLTTIELGEISKAPGEAVAGEFHDEFYVDNEALKITLIDLLYEEV